jgi:uncharacterized membrane protein HdeD (DUF308 family)
MGEHPGAATGSARRDPSRRGSALYGLGLARLTPPLWWIPATQGAVALAAAVVLLLAPGRTLALVAVAAAAYLLVLGLLRIAGALASRAEPPRDAPLQIVLGGGAVVAGLAALIRPGDEPTGVALAFGIYTMIVGLLTLTTVMRTGGRPGRVASALLDVVAGVAVVSWPPPGIGLDALALVLAGYLAVRGAVDVHEGLTLRRLGSGS